MTPTIPKDTNDESTLAQQETTPGTIKNKEMVENFGLRQSTTNRGRK